jgi:hypothetical protein
MKSNFRKQYLRSLGFADVNKQKESLFDIVLQQETIGIISTKIAALTHNH